MTRATVIIAYVTVREDDADETQRKIREACEDVAYYVGFQRERADDIDDDA